MVPSQLLSFPFIFFPLVFLSQSLGDSLLISPWFSLSGFLLISRSPFFFGFHTNSFSIFKSSSCHQFLSSIYTRACLDLGVSTLATRHFFLLIFCSYCKALFFGHWICDFVHTVFIFIFIFKNSFGLFLANLFFFLLYCFQERRPPHHWYFFSSLLSLSLSLSLRFGLLLWFLSLSHSLISSLAQLLPPSWLFILASVWVVTFVWVSLCLS